MAILNLTYQGMSADIPIELEHAVTDNDLRRIAVELLRTGGVPGIQVANLASDTFVNYVVDRFSTHNGAERIYLRPKVPFGA